MGCRIVEDVLLYGSDVFFGPVILLALSLYVNSFMGWKLCEWWFQGCMHFLLGTGTIPLAGVFISLALWLSLKCCFWFCFFSMRKSWMHSMQAGLNGLPGHWMVLLCGISWSEDLLGLMGVDCRTRGGPQVTCHCFVLYLVWSSGSFLDAQ